MRDIVGLVFIICFYVHTASGQTSSATASCAQHKINSFRNAAKATVASPEEERYDVKSVTLDLRVNSNPVDIYGIATTTATVLEDNFGLYVFELNSSLDIEMVNINGVQASFTREGDVVSVLMPTIQHKDSSFRAEVFYKGTPETGTVFFFQQGLNYAADAAWNSPVTYTLSEPYASKDWWPCKQSLQDKIDSATIAITVDDSLKAGSNGVLVATTNVGNGKTRYTWKTNYPVAYYLLSIAIADYEDYSFTTTLPDGKQVLVQNFVYNRPGFLEENKIRIDSTGNMLINFSEQFGTYPFHEEKYGHCMAPVFGGLEHQTMTTLHNFNARLVAHELAHQWWGDHVTCATWQDIWINEGFATYSEFLHYEKFRKENDAYNYMLNIHNQVLEDSVKSGSVFVPAGDTLNPYRIFDTRLSYLKPGAVLHTLRYIIDDDDIFFQSLRQFQQQYAFGNATTEDFKNVVESISGLELDYFFDQWIYGEGYPVYSVKWYQLGNKIYLSLEQETTTPSSVSLFELPVELKLVMQDEDTIIRINNKAAKQDLSVLVNGNVNEVIFDPRNMILNEDKVYRDHRVAFPQDGSEDALVYPNPTENDWFIANVKAGTELSLLDMQGRVLWQAVTNSNFGASIPAQRFAKGMYILQIQYGDKQLTSKKLIKL